MSFSIQRSRRRGFTLIEIMAAMSILMVIVLVLGNIFTDSTRIWQLGTKRAQNLGEGRAVMDFLVRELSQAFADNIVSFRLNSDQPLYGVTSYGWLSDEVYFLMALRNPGYQTGGDYMRRTGHHHIFFVTPMVDQNNNPIADRFRLVRCVKSRSSYSTEDYRLKSAYFDPEWWRYFSPSVSGGPGSEQMETIAENVAGFEIWAYSESAQKYVYSYASTNNNGQLPLWVDMYLEMFSEEESIQMADLWKLADKTAAYNYRDKHSRRYAARVYFPNRLGYSK